MTLVSIITPCYEHERYLEEYFESLLGQTYLDIELIFVDDASRDRSWAIAQDYKERLRNRFTRVVLWRNSENVGLIRALEMLMAEVHGDVVCILESDDLLYPTKVEENVAFLHENQDIGLVHSNADVLDARSTVRTPSRWIGMDVPVGDVYKHLLHENFILTCTMACRSKLIRSHIDFGTYYLRGYRTADYPMFLELSRRTTFGYIDSPLAVYRVVDGSISHPRTEIDRLRWKIDYYRIKQDFILEYGAPDDLRARADRQLHHCLMQLGWESGSAEYFDLGYSWFSEYAPETVSRWTHRLKGRALRSRCLWKTLRWIELFVAAHVRDHHRQPSEYDADEMR